MKIQRYKKLYKEEDSLANLTDISLPEKIQKFFLENPFPKDYSQFHKWAEEQGYTEASELEEYLYAFLTLIFIGGKSKGKDVTVSEQNLNIGLKIELEHVDYDTDNKVIRKMIDLLSRKIVNDHVSENDNYYIDGVPSFKDELEQEGK